MAHVFISYVSENVKLAAWIASQLSANGLDPWFSEDPGRIAPGDDWKRTLRLAIQEGGFYLPIFTAEWAKRNRSAANQELLLAAEEARLRPMNQRWMLPLKVATQPLPAIDLGGGRQLSDLQFVDVARLGWERGLTALLQAMGVENPKLERGEPLAPGFGATARIVGGFITYRNFNIDIPELNGTTFTVTEGFIRRDDKGDLVANFKLRAPFEKLQEINVQLGLDTIDVISPDKSISTSADSPTRFNFLDKKDKRGPGMPLWMMGVDDPIRTLVDVEQITGYQAVGNLDIFNRVVGTFVGFVHTKAGPVDRRVTFDGDFCLQLKDYIEPPM